MLKECSGTKLWEESVSPGRKSRGKVLAVRERTKRKRRWGRSRCTGVDVVKEA